MSLHELFEKLKETHDCFIFCGKDRETGGTIIAVDGELCEVSGCIETAIRQVCIESGVVTPMQFANILTKHFTKPGSPP